MAYTSIITNGTYLTNSAQVNVTKYVAGTPTTIAQSTFFTPNSAWATIRMWIDTSGRFAVFRDMIPANFAPKHNCLGQDAALATGGALASGKVGIYDHNPSTGTAARFFDDFIVSSFDRQPVIYASKTLQVRSDDVLRESASGYYGRPPAYRGARFRLYPAGDQNRFNRVVVRARRNVTDEFPDSVYNDNTSITVSYVPRGIVVPRDLS